MFLPRLISLVLLFIFVPAGAGSAVSSGNQKILVVMSYHQGNDWQDQQREGIENVLKDARITYFYLDTKRNPEGGPARAKEAFALYQKLHPVAVITADDHAQSLFVVPYLKNKVKTPVVFLGVNNDASKYGFPADNVTGVVEVKHVAESLNFAQLIVPCLQKIAVLYKENYSNLLNIQQMQEEQSLYPVEIVRYCPLNSFADLERIVETVSSEVDGFFSQNLAGLLDDKGKPLEAVFSMTNLALLSKKPIIAHTSYDIEAGALCGVIQTGQEQGELAAYMVLELFGGKAIRDIPIVKNNNGQRYINVNTAARLNIRLNSSAVMGSKLVK